VSEPERCLEIRRNPKSLLSPCPQTWSSRWWAIRGSTATAPNKNCICAADWGDLYLPLKTD